ncbi:hypothetical protein JCM10207_002332 [Rhodosporidiobolus poonsookiae]
MPLTEVTNSFPLVATDESSIASSPSSLNFDASSVDAASQGSDAHPWAAGKKVLKPVEEGERRREQRLRVRRGSFALPDGDEADNASPGSTSDLIEANKNLQGHLKRILLEKAELAQLLDGVRSSHAIVCAQLETARNELGNQEDELFVLRETHEEHAKQIAELRKAKEFAEVERSMAIKARQQAENTQAAQQEACVELLEEQKKLEAAYDEAVLQLEAWKAQQGGEDDDLDPSGSSRGEDSASMLDVSQDWEKVDLADIAFPVKPANVGRRATGRFLSKRRRTPSQPLLANPPPAQTLACMRADVEQLKQSLALLVREQRQSLDFSRPPSRAQQA